MEQVEHDVIKIVTCESSQYGGITFSKPPSLDAATNVRERCIILARLQETAPRHQKVQYYDQVWKGNLQRRMGLGVVRMTPDPVLRYWGANLEWVCQCLRESFGPPLLIKETHILSYQSKSIPLS